MYIDNNGNIAYLHAGFILRTITMVLLHMIFYWKNPNTVSVCVLLDTPWCKVKQQNTRDATVVQSVQIFL